MTLDWSQRLQYDRLIYPNTVSRGRDVRTSETPTANTDGKRPGRYEKNHPLPDKVPNDNLKDDFIEIKVSSSLVTLLRRLTIHKGKGHFLGLFIGDHLRCLSHLDKIYLDPVWKSIVD